MQQAGIWPVTTVQSVQNTIFTIDTGKFMLTLMWCCEVLVLLLS